MTRRLAILLGSLGTIPFLAAIFLLHALPQGSGEFGFTQYWVMGYAAIILSFLAGIHWHIALQAEKRTSIFLLISSNIVTILAWFAFCLQFAVLSFSLLLTGYLLQIVIDYYLYRNQQYQSWYWYLRVCVTLVVVICLITILTL